MPDTATAMESAPGFAKNPTYKIKIERADRRIIASVGGKVVANTKRARIMTESNRKPVYYFPREDVRMELFQRTDLTTYCAYKGEASYWSIRKTRDGKNDNAAWSYETPFRESMEIKGFIGFYASKIDIRAQD